VDAGVVAVSPATVSSVADAGVAPPGVLVGEYCPGKSITGLLRPLAFATGRSWSAKPQVLDLALRSTSSPFAMITFKAKIDGAFRLEHLETLPSGGLAATGTQDWWGWSGCVEKLGPNKGVESKACDVATEGCTLTFALVGGDTQRYIPPWRPGAACVAQNRLVMDVDGDGNVESFALPEDAALVDLEPVNVPRAQCKPTFSDYPDLGGHPRVIDILGVADFDGDGRTEVVLALRTRADRMVGFYALDEASHGLRPVSQTRWSSARVDQP
jgi:hypothetical protein